MRYQVDFFASIEATKTIILFWVMLEILLANQFAGFFTSDLFDLLILIQGVHCYILLVFNGMRLSL